MVSFSGVLICLATLAILTSASSVDGPEAEERKFHELKKSKLAPLIEKKNWFLSLFSRSPQPQHTLTPLQFPIWKIHKYKGIELRPVQVIDVPASFDYIQPTMYAPPVRMPHTEYGPPVNSEEAPVTGKFGHGERLRSFLSVLKSHKNLFKNLKSWKFGPRPEYYSSEYGVSLPEVEEVPIKGLDNLDIQVPQLPPINLPYYTSTFSAGPYVSVKFGNPYQYATPVETYLEQSPAPYYGAPPLFDSYGTPLPPDAYSSAPSEQIPSFAVPETLPLDYQPNSQVKDTSSVLNSQQLLEQGQIKKFGLETENPEEPIRQENQNPVLSQNEKQ